MSQSQCERVSSLSGAICKGWVNPKLDKYSAPEFATEFFNQKNGDSNSGEMILEALQESFLEI